MAEYVNQASAQGTNTNCPQVKAKLIALAGNANLTMTKDVAPNPAYFGDVVTYTITVTNQGPQKALDVVMKDNGSTHVDLDISTATTTQGVVDGSSNTHYLQVNIGDIAVGVTVIITVQGTVLVP